MSMIPSTRVNEASRDFLCDTLTNVDRNDPSIPANHVLKLTRNHIKNCVDCRNRMNKKSVVQDYNTVQRMVNLSIGKGLMNKQPNGVEIKLNASSLKNETISGDKADKLKRIAQHIIDSFVASYQ